MLVRRHKEDVVPLVALRPKRLQTERRYIEPLIDRLVEIALGHHIGAVAGNSRILLRSGCIQNRKWLAGRTGVNAVDLPPLDDLTGDSAKRFAKRQLVVRTDNEPVLHHVVAWTVIASEIVEYLSASIACAAGAADIGKSAAVDVVCAEGQPSPITPLKLDLQSVIVADTIGL